MLLSERKGGQAGKEDQKNTKSFQALHCAKTRINILAGLSLKIPFNVLLLMATQFMVVHKIIERN